MSPLQTVHRGGFPAGTKGSFSVFLPSSVLPDRVEQSPG
jgi:hypothetical protein